MATSKRTRTNNGKKEQNTEK